VNVNELVLDEKYQTISIIGVDKKEIVDFITSKRLRGVDRVVSVGKTLDFDLGWV